MSLDSLFRREGDKIVDALRASYDRFGVNASGDLSRTTESKVLVAAQSISLQIIVNKYALTLEPGRGPTRNNQGGKLYPAIRKWVDDKGVGEPAKRDGIAWAITKSIHKKGTRAFPNKGPKVLSSVINDRLIDDIVRKAADSAEITYIEQIESMFRTR